MNSSISDRIFRLIEALDISIANFSDRTGIDRGSLSHIKSSRSKPTLEMIKKIVSSYPEVSLDWLILGGGTMLKQSENPHELDLFTQLPANTSVSTLKEPIMPQISVQTKSYNETNPQKTSENSVLSSNQNPSAPPHIKRILIFYSDNTYEEIIR